MGKTPKESSIKKCWEIVPNWDCLFVNREKRLPICVCGRQKTDWKETKHFLTSKLVMKDVDLGEPTSFLDHVYLGCTQRKCQIGKDIVDKLKKFESMEKLPEAKAPGKPETNTFSSWSYNMESRAKKCVEKDCELATKTTQQIWMTTNLCEQHTSHVTRHIFSLSHKDARGSSSSLACAAHISRHLMRHLHALMLCV